MLKKISIIMVLLNLFTCFNVFASEKMENDKYYDIITTIAPYITNDGNENISREDCIITIMKILGVDEYAADSFGDFDWDRPVFSDIPYSDSYIYTGWSIPGYIILAKFSNIAIGVDFHPDGVNHFAPYKNVTVKECLTFMLRCLTEPSLVLWDNVMEDSVKFGLLQEDESEFYIADNPITKEQFYTLLSRMLDKNRYLYWPQEDMPGTNKFDKNNKYMKVDLTNSIKYGEWLADIIDDFESPVPNVPREWLDTTEKVK